MPEGTIEHETNDDRYQRHKSAAICDGYDDVVHGPARISFNCLTPAKYAIATAGLNAKRVYSYKHCGVYQGQHR